MSNISYSAVILDERSRKKILNKFKSLIPKDWEIITHHMTINMGEINPEYENYLGMTVKLTILDFAIDDKVAAVGVSGFPSNNKKPHITLAVNRRNGGKPFLSNKLTNWKGVDKSLTVVGKVEEVPFK